MVYDTTQHFALEAEDEPAVVRLPDGAALHYQGWSRMPQGFSVSFTRAHLGLLRHLLATLEEAPEAPPTSEGA